MKSDTFSFGVGELVKRAENPNTVYYSHSKEFDDSLYVVLSLTASGTGKFENSVYRVFSFKDLRVKTFSGIELRRLTLPSLY